MFAAILALIMFPQNLNVDLLYEFDRLYNRAPVEAPVPELVYVAPQPVIAQQAFILPTGSPLVSGWYYMDPRFGDGPIQHTGIDYACLTGHPIVAAASGVVLFATWNGDCGNEVAVSHGNGVITYYCHLSGFASRGWVNQGDVIGFCGNSGLSTGPHLHYEKRIAGVPVDPTQ